MDFPRICVTGVLCATLLLPTSAHSATFRTSFEFSESGPFVIGEAPFIARFTGGRAQTVGIGAYYHSGRFSWHVPAGGSAAVMFETPADDVAFWFRDTNGAAGGSYRIIDTQGSVIDSGSATQSFVNVQLSRSGMQRRIARLEFDGARGGDTVVDDFSYTANQPEPDPDDSTDNPIAQVIETSAIAVDLDEMVSGLVAPVWATTAPGDNDGLYIVDQAGQIIRLNLLDKSTAVFFDVSSSLVPLGAFGPESFDERGLLGLAFHPNYQSNGLLYTYTSEPASSPPDYSTLPEGATANHQTVIAEWRVNSPLDIRSRVNTGSRRELLRIDQPQFNHNGGNLAFGPDGHLFISLGDGGNADDEGEGHGANGNGGDNTTILGSLLRIDPTGDNSANGHYGIPSDNPLIGLTPVTEIYASGLRNPYRFSFDRQNGALWLADVGQNSIEEINKVQAGGDYGWNSKEGSFFFQGNGSADGTVTNTDPGVPAGLIDPVAEYDHDEGIAIVGGFVYRGSAVNKLAGRYIFGDFGSFDADAGRIFHLNANNTPLVLDVGDDTRLPLAILGFGQDSQGEIYVLTNTTGTPFGTTGTVYRLAAPAGTPGGITRDKATAIARLYAAAFDRFPKKDGLNFWVDRYEDGQTLEQIAERFVLSPELTQRFGQLNSKLFVEQLFRNILGREPAQAGIDFWLGHLNNGVPRARVLMQLSDSPENREKTKNYDLRVDIDGEWKFCTTEPAVCLEG
jgi:glucose/arabinose dehydrogenase